MIRHPLYLIYGLLILGTTAGWEYRGWSMARINELRNVPKSVRDNPGSYRSHYGNYSRYHGGK